MPESGESPRDSRRDADVTSVTISPTDDSGAFIRDWDDDYDVSEFLVSATITARKPGGADG